MDVEPFSLDEVKLILDNVRSDFRNYYTVRFFTGMRTSEIDGLQWQFIDFERKQILIRRAWVKGELIGTKNDGSFRTIEMSDLVYQALQSQKSVTGDIDYVFCSNNYTPLTHRNITCRIWKPLLANLGLTYRRPYQTRHTAATLWLAAGRVLSGLHVKWDILLTTMLFRVYSRFVPNLTRQDGTAMERLLSANGLTKQEKFDDE